MNESCPRLRNFGVANYTNFNGSLIKVPSVGHHCIGEEGKLECHFCKHPAICLAPCHAFVYYVMPTTENMSRLMLHCGKHDHPIRSGVSKRLRDRVKEMVSRVVATTHTTRARQVQMCMAKEIVMASFTREIGAPEFIGEEDLSSIAEEMGPLVQDGWYIYVTND